MKTLSIVSVTLFAGLGLTALAMNSCSGGGTKADPDARPLPDARVIPDDANIALRCDPVSGTDLVLQEVVRGLADPLFLTAPADDERLFVLEQPGKIMIVDDNALLPTPFLDLEAIVRDTSSEQGLLGLAFHPDYATNGKFYVNYTATAPQGATVVAEYTVSSNPNVADIGTARIVLSFAQPFSNHNGGMIAFGPDGYLYIGTGDGGSGDDPQGNGQNLNTFLGKMLRIDVDNGAPYGIPVDNPFAAGGGLPEIYSYGLRNPWRFSFDRENGNIYIADVGQGTLEEVDVETSALGLNFGWKIAEGKQCRGGGGNCDTTGLTAPVHDYGRGDGRSITGGYVYRGTCMPDVQGMYFFGDFTNERIWTFEYQGGDAIANHTDRTSTIDPNGDIVGLTSFGEDAFGELYVISQNGKVFKLVPKPAL